MIPYANRFHGHSSLRYVYTHGKADRSHILTIKWVTNPHRKKTRVAVVVSKKIIKSAVGRNRIRRRLYEYIRQQLPAFTKTYDIVLIATSAELATMPYEELTNQVQQQLINTELVKPF